MFVLKIENKNGQKVELTQNESNYQVINIEGLNPPKSDIYTNAVANMDGQKFKSSKLEMRNIVLTIKVNGDAEKNRIALYSYFGTGKWCKIFYKNGSRDVYIEGYCENIECPLFTVDQRMQISIVCPDPYLKSMETMLVDISKLLADFTFPFVIDDVGVQFSHIISDRRTVVVNDGELATGINIRIIAREDNVSNPIIYNTDTGEYMLIETTMNKGDEILIDTNKGRKSITKIVNGEKENIINSLSGSSTWLQLESGINTFTYEIDNIALRGLPEHSKLIVEFEYNHRYEGV